MKKTSPAKPDPNAADQPSQPPSTSVLRRPPESTVLMRADRVRHLVVVEDGRVVSMVSARDILVDAAAEAEKHIRGLEADRLVMTTNTGAY
ncbi:CBS domain-containing protein [Belnapia moabensis]|uniref:hypothetical protein n=1 Tax=Belnapia moabensis TaxID=365533 RepID=UPI00146FEF38|nr:hypothetical protein [Belnapia moabensis]